MITAYDPELLIINARVMTCAGGPADPLAIVEDGSIICGGGAVLGIQRGAASARGATVIDAGGRLVSPGLVDCHAHPLFAGDRAAEFAMRARGATYQEIAAAGGGIAATLGPTRAASFEELLALTLARTGRAITAGTTTMEAKSGYDLTCDGELRLLEVARVASEQGPVELVPTLLAHVIPPERRDDRDAYVDEIVTAWVPRAAKHQLARAVDVYCDEGAFTLAETRRILVAARAAGLAVRAHVGQFVDLGGPELIAELGGRSVDHLEQVSPAGIAALAAAKVVAVMLPGACVQLRMTPPPVAALRAAGVAMAIASDLNPGTSLCETLPVQMWLATTHYGMTVEEAWLGVTRYGAQVLDRPELGALFRGCRADLVLWDADHPAQIPYHYGVDQVAAVWKAGVCCVDHLGLVPVEDA